MGSGEWGVGSGEEGFSLFVVRETHGSLALFSMTLITSQELKFLAHSSSPLKWTKILIQSSLDDFSFEPGV